MSKGRGGVATPVTPLPPRSANDRVADSANESTTPTNQCTYTHNDFRLDDNFMSRQIPDTSDLCRGQSEIYL